MNIPIHSHLMVPRYIPIDWQAPPDFPFAPIYLEAARLGIPIRVVEGSQAPVRIYVGEQAEEHWLEDVPSTVLFLGEWRR